MNIFHKIIYLPHSVGFSIGRTYEIMLSLTLSNTFCFNYIIILIDRIFSTDTSCTTCWRWPTNCLAALGKSGLPRLFYCKKKLVRQKLNFPGHFRRPLVDGVGAWRRRSKKALPFDALPFGGRHLLRFLSHVARPFAGFSVFAIFIDIFFLSAVGIL